MATLVMVVEDDPAVRRLVTFLFENEGFEVAAHEGPRSARGALADEPPDLFLVDLGESDNDAVDFGRELRARAGYARVPIVALTARNQTVDKYEAYRAGFDGYFTKPFDPIELVFSVRALLRLARPAEEESARELGPEGFRLAPAKFTVSTDRGAITLTRLETAVLHHLMKHSREVFSAAELADIVLQGGHGRTRTVDAVHAHIRNLRLKVELDPRSPKWVKTMGRRGYFFDGLPDPIKAHLSGHNWTTLELFLTSFGPR